MTLVRSLIKFSWLLLVFAIESKAGGGIDGGGGMVFTCPSTKPAKIFLVDTYKQQKVIEKLKISDPELILRAAIIFFKNHSSKIFKDNVFIDPRNPQGRVSLSWMIEYKKNNLIFSPSTEPLPLLGDDHISFKEIPSGCQKKQLAIQKISAGNVLYDPKLESGLSFFDAGFFKLHEILISIRNSPGLDTTEIRDEIDSILSENMTSFQMALIQIVPLIISQSKRVFLFENTKRDLCHFEGSSFSSFNLSKKELIKSAVCRFFDTAISFQEVISSKPMAALKTLKRVPTELICRITATAKNDFNYQNKILVVSKLNEGNSLKEFLYVYKNQRSDYESSLTKFRFSWSWENLMSKDKYSLIIENYSELAEEFNGRLYILNEQNPQKLSHFGVACRSLSKDDLFE